MSLIGRFGVLVTAIAMAASAALAPTSASAQWSSFEPGIDRKGADYTSFNIDGGPRACRNTCLVDERCRAWTYVRAGYQGPGPRCWLKAARPEPRDSDCCVSGTIHGR